MRKLLIFSAAMLFGSSTFAAMDYQKYGECVKKNESKINGLKSFCDTEAKARLNQAKCTEITKISLKCQCDNLGTKESCDALKKLGANAATPAPKATAKKAAIKAKKQKLN